MFNFLYFISKRYLCTMLASRIKEIIKQKKTTSIEVAKDLGMTNVYFSKMINGNPTVSSLEAIAKVLNCEVGDFFNKSEPIALKYKNDLIIFHSEEEFKKFAEEQ